MSRTTVTLLTDFGAADPYVSAMKGVILSLAPETRFVDISHEIAGCDILGGALALADAAPLFPPGTIHLAVVDPGVGGKRAPLLVASSGHYYIGPDNGLLSLAAVVPRTVRRLTNESFFRLPLSDTFHGRDLFAPVAGHLADGTAVEEFGSAVEAMVELELPVPVSSDGAVRGQVLTVDRFGNLMTNISAARLPGPAENCRVGLGQQRIDGISTSYAGAGPGRLVALISSRGTLEIAVAQGSAAACTGAERGTPVIVETV